MTVRKSELLREQYESWVHPCGLPIYVFPKQLTSTYAILSTRYGSVDDKFRLQGEKEWITVPDGVAHFLEHKMFENPDGTDAFEHFSEYGADANAYTTHTRTAYLFSCTGDIEKPLEELLRFVTTPYFTPETVQKEQGIIGEEIRMYDDNPWERCFHNLSECLYQSNSIRKNICGTVATIAEITAPLLYDCHKVFYQPSNMVLIVCGNVTAEQIQKTADRILPQKWENHPIERCWSSEDGKVFQSRNTVKMQVDKPIFAIGIKDPKIPESPQERLRKDAAVSILQEILFSRSGDFYNKLYEAGLLSGGYSYEYVLTERAAFQDICGSSDDPEKVFAELTDYLEQVRRNGIDKESFERCRRVLYADEIRSYDSTEEIANSLLSAVFADAELFEYPTVLNQITLAELNQLMQELFQPEYFSMSVVEPLQTNDQTGKQ